MIKKRIAPFVSEEWLVSAVFAIKMVLVYAGWKLFSRATEHVSFIHGFWQKVSDAVANLEVNIAVGILRLFLDERITVYPRNIILDHSQPVYVADHCLGLSGMFIFAAFILVIEGNTKHKLWFIPFGILLIAVINATRVAALCYIFKYAPQWFEFNHSYVYVVLTYGAIFLMLMWWMERFYNTEASTH